MQSLFFPNSLSHTQPYSDHVCQTLSLIIFASVFSHYYCVSLSLFLSLSLLYLSIYLSLSFFSNSRTFFWLFFQMMLLLLQTSAYVQSRSKHVRGRVFCEISKVGNILDTTFYQFRFAIKYMFP